MPIRAADLPIRVTYDTYPRGIDFPLDCTTPRIYAYVDIICLTEEMILHHTMLDYYSIHPDGDDFINVEYWESSSDVVGPRIEDGTFYNARCICSSGEEVYLAYRAPIIPIAIREGSIIICGAPYFANSVDLYHIEDASQTLTPPAEDE